MLRVLRDANVEVSDLPDSRFRLSKDSVIETVRLLEVVSRTKCAHFSRLFGIPIVAFFPPIKAPAAVIPIERGKASGESE